MKRERSEKEWTNRKRFKKEPVHLLNLPQELFIHIFQYLGIQEKSHVSTVCKQIETVPFTHSYFLGIKLEKLIENDSLPISFIIPLQKSLFLNAERVVTHFIYSKMIEYIVNNRKNKSFHPLLNQNHEYHFFDVHINDPRIFELTYDAFHELKNPYPFQFVFYFDHLVHIPDYPAKDHSDDIFTYMIKKSQWVVKILVSSNHFFTCPYHKIVFEKLNLEDYIGLDFQMENNKILNCTVSQVDLILNLEIGRLEHSIFINLVYSVDQFLKAATQMKQRTGKLIQRLNIEFQGKNNSFLFTHLFEQCILLGLVEEFCFCFKHSERVFNYPHLKYCISYIYERTKKPIFLLYHQYWDQFSYDWDGAPFVLVFHENEMKNSKLPFSHPRIEYYEIIHDSSTFTESHLNIPKKIYPLKEKGKLVYYPEKNKSHFYPFE